MRTVADVPALEFLTGIARRAHGRREESGTVEARFRTVTFWAQWAVRHGLAASGPVCLL